MQLTSALKPIAGSRQAKASRRVARCPEQAARVESQTMFDAFQDFLRYGRGELEQLKAELSWLEMDPSDAVTERKVSERLNRFCLESDVWGFDTLYQVGTGLQVFLRCSRGQVQDRAFWVTMNRGVGMLSSLLDHCENDFRQRLAVAEILESIDRLIPR